MIGFFPITFYHGRNTIHLETYLIPNVKWHCATSTCNFVSKAHIVENLSPHSTSFVITPLTNVI